MVSFLEPELNHTEGVVAELWSLRGLQNVTEGFMRNLAEGSKNERDNILNVS